MLAHSAAQVGTSATLIAAAQSTMNRWVAVQNLGPNDPWGRAWAGSEAAGWSVPAPLIACWWADPGRHHHQPTSTH